jgi:ribosomal protein S12 methylthiotransferase accessory factor
LTSVNALSRGEEQQLLGDFIDLETGIIRELLRPGVGYEDPDWFFGIALPARIWNTGLFPGRHSLSEGNAVGDSDQTAVLGAIGETLERYCLAFYDRSALVFTSYDDAAAHGLTRLADPEDFALFAPEQQPSWCVPFTRQSPVYWTEGFSLADKRSKWVPAQLVYLPYFPGADEDYVFSSNSSGTAFGPTWQSAALSGLCEVVERDAFAIYWLNRLELPALDLGSDPVLAGWYRGMFGKFDNELEVFDITTDLEIPCFFTVLKGRPGQCEPFLSVGAACHPDPMRALQKAVMEAFHTRRYGMSLMQLEGVEPDERRPWSAESNKFSAHVLRYTRPVPGHEIDFLYRPRRRLPIGPVLAAHRQRELAPARYLRHCLDRLQACGLEAIAVDLTTQEIAEKGFVTAKVVVPGLHPLWAGEDVPLGGKRLYEVPVRLGHPIRLREHMNLFPHPFP